MVYGLWSTVYGLWPMVDGVVSGPSLEFLEEFPEGPVRLPRCINITGKHLQVVRCVRVCACMCVRACVNMRACVHERVVQYYSTCNDGQKAWSAPTRCEYGADLPPSIPTSMFHAPSLV